jgi:phage gp36-like protein
VPNVKARNHALLDDLEEDDAGSGEITDAIKGAQDIVDGMLRKLYPVPLSTAPDTVVKITADLAAATCIADVVGNTGADEDPIQAQDLRKNAMDLLKMINAGDLQLDIAPPVVETSVMKQARCTTYYSHPKFNHWDPSDPRTYRDHRHGRR